MLNKAIEFGTDIGPPCDCESTIYGYGVGKNGWVTVQCIGCHKTTSFDVLALPAAVELSPSEDSATALRQLHTLYVQSCEIHAPCSGAIRIAESCIGASMYH